MQSPSPPRKHPPPHRAQRRRVSALRLSTDTSASLPDYQLATAQDDLDIPSDRPPDYPDSAEEADEETEVDIDDPYVPPHHSSLRYRHLPPHTASPRRQKRFLQPQQQQQSSSATPGRASHKRRHSSTASLKGRTDSDDVDTYLDTLLERSVHALEMSNTLLESSMSTQASMSALFSPEYHSGNAESALEARAIGLSSTLLRNWDAQEGWAEQLDRIKQGVDSLFPSEPMDSMTRSMPSSSPLGDLSSPLGRRPSMDQLRQASQLRYAPQDRETLVSPAPRALTMYIDANSISSTSLVGDAADFRLPSTLGKRRSHSLLHPTGSVYATSSSTASSSTTNLFKTHSPALEPQLTHRLVDPSTPAYSMLSNLAARSSAVNLNASSSTLALPIPSSSSSTNITTASAPSSFVSSFLSNMSSLARRNSSPPPPPPHDIHTSNSSTNSPRRSSRSTTVTNSRRHSPTKGRRSISADQRSIASSRSSRSRGNGNDSPVVVVRQMTPPTEGTDEDAENSSSSSSDGCVAKRTVVSLRKILDEQPPPAQPPPTIEGGDDAVGPSFSTFPNNNNTLSEAGDDKSVDTATTKQWLRPPAFMPRSPAVVPSAGTSTATASISRMFTKGVHTSSTRPRSPPLRSVMKRRGGSESVSPSPSMSHFGGGIGTGSGGENGDGSTGVATPPMQLQPQPQRPESPSAFGITGLGTLVSRAFSSSSMSSGPSGSTTPSSGFSTPKRISFATLPESYASTKPEGEAGSVERRKKKSRSRSHSSSGGSSKRRSEEYNAKAEDGAGKSSSWWASWLGGADLAGGSGHGIGTGRDRERLEDRMTRRMGMSMHGGGGGGHLGVMDEWGV